MGGLLPDKLSTSDLKKHIDTIEMRTQLLNQTLKDLEVEEMRVDVTQKSFFVDLSNEVTFVMKHFIENQPQKLPNLIYRIDLNERTVRTILQNTDLDASEGLADLIIKREMQKVFYRNVYNGNIKL